MTERDYTLYDIESGEPYKVTKEYYDKYMANLESFKSFTANPTIGNVIMYGTVEGSKSTKSFYEIWKDIQQVKVNKMNDTMTIGETTSDQQIIELMLQSKTINEWNENRELIKTIRTSTWIGVHLDASGLINQSNINKKQTTNLN